MSSSTNKYIVEMSEMEIVDWNVVFPLGNNWMIFRTRMVQRGHFYTRM